LVARVVKSRLKMGFEVVENKLGFLVKRWGMRMFQIVGSAMWNEWQ